MILDGFKVPRKGLGRRRWRPAVIQALLDEYGDSVELLDSDVVADAKALIAEGYAETQALKEADRRLRLGVILSLIITDHGVSIQPTQINRAVMEEARRRSPVEGDVLGHFRSNFRSMASIQASILEKLALDVVYEKARAS